MLVTVSCVVTCYCSTESSDSMGGQAASHSVDEHKLGSALNPNRAEVPGAKRKGLYDQVKTVVELTLCVQPALFTLVYQARPLSRASGI